MSTGREMQHHPELVGGGNCRRTGRVRVCLIRCTLGEVLDISATGMRVCCRGRAPEQGAEVHLCLEGLVRPVELTANVVWVRKTGWRKYQLGLAFTDLTPEAKSELAAIARAVPLNDSLKKAG